MKENNNSHSVITNEVVPERVEVIAVDSNGMVDEKSIDYNEYRDELKSFYRRTNIENSVISTFSFNNDSCKHVLVVKENSKERVIKEKIFKYDESFINNFLAPMVEDYKKENFVFDSKIEILGENQSNLIIRTKLNDSLIFLGGRVELSKKLNDIVSKKSVNLEDKNTNERGVSTFVALGLLVVSMIMLFAGIIILYGLR